MPYALPEVIDPPQIEVCVPVPDDVNHKRAFLAQLNELQFYWNWDKDPTERAAADAAAVWRQIYFTVFDRLMAGEGCGGEEVPDERTTAILQALADIKNEMRTKLIYDGTPGSINPSAPGLLFDQGSAGESFTERLYRAAALCLAVRQYIYNTMHQAHAAYAAGAGVVGVPATIAFLFGGPLGMVAGGIVLTIAAIVYNDVLEAASDTAMLDQLVCDLYKALKGLPVSEANFQAALDGLDDGTGTRATAANFMKSFRNRQENYVYLLDLLGAGYDAALAGAEDECCPPECGFDVDLRINAGGAFVGYGTLVLGAGLKATSLTGGSNQYEARIEFFFEEPCYATHANMRWRITESDGSFNAYWYIRRASDNVWSPASGGIPVDDTTWRYIPTGGLTAYYPYNAIRFRLLNYSSAPPNCQIERVATTSL